VIDARSGEAVGSLRRGERNLYRRFDLSDSRNIQALLGAALHQAFQHAVGIADGWCKDVYARGLDEFLRFRWSCKTA
jgi:hypothetical protein